MGDQPEQLGTEPVKGADLETFQEGNAFVGVTSDRSQGQFPKFGFMGRQLIISEGSSRLLSSF